MPLRICSSINRCRHNYSSRNTLLRSRSHTDSYCRNCSSQQPLRNRSSTSSCRRNSSTARHRRNSNTTTPLRNCSSTNSCCRSSRTTIRRRKNSSNRRQRRRPQQLHNRRSSQPTQQTPPTPTHPHPQAVHTVCSTPQRHRRSHSMPLPAHPCQHHTSQLVPPSLPCHRSRATHPATSPNCLEEGPDLDLGLDLKPPLTVRAQHVVRLLSRATALLPPPHPPRV